MFTDSTTSSTAATNGKAVGWNEATKDNPCPICSKDRRCKIAPDGNAVCCFSSNQAPIGWRVTKQHSEGCGATFQRDCTANPGRKRQSNSSGMSHSLPRLSADRLHEAYSLLFEHLDLIALHGANLLRRGLNIEQIAERQYRSMPLSAGTRMAIAEALAATLGGDFVAVPGFGFKDGKPTLFGAYGMLIPVRNVRGQIIAAIIRSDSPEAENRYTFLSSSGERGGNSPGSPGHVPLGVVGPLILVRTVEGHLKADIVSAHDDVPTISFGGVGNWRKGIELARELGATVVRVAFDADARIKKEVAQNLLAFMRTLRDEGFNIELERWSLDDGKGLDDLLAARKKPELLSGDDAMTAAVEIAKAAGVDPDAVKASSPKTSSGADSSEGKKSQATILVELASEAELFHDTDGEAHARFRVGDGEDGHWEVSRVAAKGFRRWLKHRFYRGDGKAPSAQSLQDALGVIEAQAIHDGEKREVFIRVAELDDRIYIDLGNECWQAVEVDRTGWRVVDEPPVMFRRAKAMRSLPLPEQNGDAGELRRFANVSDEDWPLVLAWLVAAMRPTGPYPVLAVYGEQGSAKSTLCRFCRQIADPNRAPLRADYREPRDLMICANNGWIVALDNLSTIPPWLSDCLCRLATGGGFSTRTLYENDEETIFDAKRPVILNCIDEVVTRSDLLDRCVILNLPRIEEASRVAEKQLNREFEAALPRILGGLLSAVSAALRNEDHVKLPMLPRMADFAIWVTAAEPAMGLQEGEFLRAYTANRAAGNETAIEASPVGRALIEFIVAAGEWAGTSTDLLAALDERTDDKTRKLESWPSTPRALSGKVKRLAPNLREAGIGVEFGRKGHKGARTIAFTSRREQSGNQPSASSAPSAAEESPKSGVACADTSADDAGVSPVLASAERSVSPETNGYADATDGADAKIPARSVDREQQKWCEV